MNELSHNFIIGIGRSGTTLLMNMLNNHEEIMAFPEIRFFNFFYYSWKNKKDIKHYDLNAIQTYFLVHKSRINHSPYRWNKELFMNLLNINKPRSFSNIYSAFFNSFTFNGESKKTKFIFDKNPINTLFAEDISEEFPMAKFIFMVRDPRANYLSRKQKVIFSDNIYFNCYRWKFINECALKFQKKYPNKTLIIKYENLVTNPENQLKSIADFCGFDYSANMLDFHKTVRNTRDIPFIAKHDKTGLLENKLTRLSEPVNTKRLNTWQNELSDQEINIISGICHSTAAELGYTMPYTRSGTLIKKLIGWLKAKADFYKSKLLFKTPLAIKLWLVKRKSG